MRAVDGKEGSSGGDARGARLWGGGAEVSQACSSTAKHLSQCLDTSCLVAMETPQLWLMGGSSEVSREMGVVEKEGGERKGKMFLVNVRC